jgi:carbon-monoxide dehydrogenase catalytic subunit
LEVAQWLGVDTTVEVEGKQLDRDIDEIAVEVGEKALNEWGKAEGELLFAKRAPQPRYDLWKKRGVVPRNIDREIVEIMHRTHIGVDQDYKNLMKQGTRAAIADGSSGHPVWHPLSGGLRSQSRSDERRHGQHRDSRP